jgi:GDP-4-dehydro-6-deoxy-D-mannose reductase
MKILLTGSDGFIGGQLSRTLSNKGHTFHSFKGEIRNLDEVRTFVKNHPSDLVIHLAGLAHTSICEKDPKLAHDVNVKGTENLLVTLKENPTSIPILFPSSAQIYAATEHGKKIEETYPIEPQNVYAQTKWEAEKLFHSKETLGKNYAIILRLFNHTHKSQSPDFFLPRIYHELMKIKNRQAEELVTGNVELYRDIGAIQDLIAAFALLAEKSVSHQGVETFNICSGTSKQLKSLIMGLAKRLDIQPKIKTDPSKIRKNDPEWICGSFEKVNKHFGWQPQYQTETQLIDAFLKD